MTTTTQPAPRELSSVLYLRQASDTHRWGGATTPLERQRRTCEDYARRHGLTITKVYADYGVSGNTPRRRALDQMLRDLSTGIAGHVLTADQARLARNPQLRLAIQLDITCNGAQLVICDQPEEGGDRADHRRRRN